MSVTPRGYSRPFHGLVLAVAVILASGCGTIPAASEPANAPSAVTFLIGRGTDSDFTKILTEPWETDFVDVTLIGAMASTRLGTLNELFGSTDSGGIGEDISVEVEAGASYHFGDETLGEFWGALYFRYDDLPWNETVYTTIAINTGLSLLTETSDLERDRNGRTSRVLHYLAPEITVADPDNKNLEWVLRLHHRSGVFGLIDGVTGGSTFVSTGIRLRF